MVLRASPLEDVLLFLVILLEVYGKVEKFVLMENQKNGDGL